MAQPSSRIDWFFFALLGAIWGSSFLFIKIGVGYFGPLELVGFRLFSFRLLARWDATRASMVTYLLPIVGVTLGAVVLGEQVDARIVVGVALIVGGVAAVNLRRAGAPSASGGLPAEA